MLCWEQLEQLSQKNLRQILGGESVLSAPHTLSPPPLGARPAEMGWLGWVYTRFTNGLLRCFGPISHPLFSLGEELTSGDEDMGAEASSTSQ